MVEVVNRRRVGVASCARIMNHSVGFTRRAKGLVPLPGVKTRAHADEVVGCLGWELEDDDVAVLDAAHDVSPTSVGLALFVTSYPTHSAWKVSDVVSVVCVERVITLK